ncbi:preprotein translocase subunit SecG [Sphingomicrobium sp. XHP0239]|uniref:preprotein translocase subunit SecG n=1 Tax=Sphingomicrobium maritimum TaxID=3133972 RepID=UPI0031CC97F1
MFTFLLVVQTLVAAALVGVILMQRSEGGGLGVGGSSSGFMSARGQADFLTRSTGVLAIVFVVMAIVLAALAATRDTGGELDTSLQGETTIDIQAPLEGDEPEPVPVGSQPTLPEQADGATEGEADVPLGQ